MTTLNTNDYVQVRLTTEGIARHRKHYCDLAAAGEVPLKEIMPVLEPDAQGWIKFQLHDLMLIFGPEMYAGNTRDMFVDNEVRISRT